MGLNAKQQAKRDAERTRNRAFWNQTLRTLRRMPNELLPFETIRNLYPNSESYRGVKAIPVQQIVGSVDRYRDFDHYFLPRLEFPLNKWIGIRQARLEGKELPAIQVYQVGEIFFVKDGHHRVSVARDEGQVFIDAEIIELNVPVKPDAKDSLKDIIIKGEYARFLEKTKLDKLKPQHVPILFSVTGRYDILLEHIHTHQYYLGKAEERDVSWDEAVVSWYDSVFYPVIQDMREFRVLSRFPGRSEADLYLWIMDHRWYLRERFGQDVGSQQATTDYVQRYSPMLLKRVWQRLQNRWRGHSTP